MGVISCCGIGFDINGGIGLISTNINYDEIRPGISKLVNSFYKGIPNGVEKRGILKSSKQGADVSQVSSRAIQLGLEQVGILWSGNHILKYNLYV